MNSSEHVVPGVESSPEVRIDVPLNSGRPRSGTGGTVHVHIRAATVTLSVGRTEIGTLDRATFRAWLRYPEIPVRAGAAQWSRTGEVTSLRIDSGIAYIVPSGTLAHLESVI